jgi:hypothetical protein
MRFRLGVLVGFGAGYYLGAKAGRERYERLRGMIRKAKQSEVSHAATDKAKAVADLGVERAREFVGDHVPGSGSHAGDGGHEHHEHHEHFHGGDEDPVITPIPT